MIAGTALLVAMANGTLLDAAAGAPQSSAAAAGQIDGARSRWEISCNIRKD